ncbi:TetR/AcrR family transcriptional regulator [Nonomuraea sp. H19]|uniref:TetR/AcrR family transcriptional regulator n=1 Tax=Nonomuraea sp. H19 TaxID=3452206 RepID=UPI003F8A0CB0
MPRPKSNSREKIVESARRLLSSQGYQGTGLAQIVAESGAPRGSTYFLFPGGKEEIAVAAVRAAAADSVAFIVECRRASRTAREWVSTMGAHFARHLEESGYTEGLPMTTVTLDSVPGSAALSAACHEAYESWVTALEESLVAYGVAAEEARGPAMLMLATLEGGMILARAYRSLEPLELIQAQILALLPDQDQPTRRGTETSVP